MVKPVDTLFPGRKDAIEKGECFVQRGLGETCLGDGTTAKGFRDEESEREYRLTGFCQECQDAVYASLEAREGEEQPEEDIKEYVERLSDEDLQLERRAIDSYLGENGPNWEFETDEYTQAVMAECKRRNL